MPQDLSPRKPPVVTALPTPDGSLIGVTVVFGGAAYWCDGSAWNLYGSGVGGTSSVTLAFAAAHG